MDYEGKVKSLLSLMSCTSRYSINSTFLLLPQPSTRMYIYCCIYSAAPTYPDLQAPYRRDSVSLTCVPRAWHVAGI